MSEVDSHNFFGGLIISVITALLAENFVFARALGVSTMIMAALMMLGKKASSLAMNASHACRRSGPSVSRRDDKDMTRYIPFLLSDNRYRKGWIILHNPPFLSFSV